MPVNQAPTLPGNASGGVTPQTQLAPVSPPPAPSGGAQLGSPLFDPYRTNPNAGNLNPFSPTPPTNGQPFGGLLPGGGGNEQPLGLQPFGTSSLGPPPANPVYGNPGAAAMPPPANGTQNPYAAGPPPTTYPQNAYPTGTPSTLFPGGVFNGSGGNGWWTPMSASLPEPLRLIQGPRLQYAWLGGGSDPTDLGINDVDASVAFAFPNFLYSTQPLYVLPSFSLHLWDGPQGGTADLPSKAYSAFLDAGWQSDPMRIFGAELGLRVGVFSDFDTMNADSLRVQGRGLGIFRLSPTTTLKAGVMYIDRNDIKLLPAGGILWQPNPGVRYDIYFPEPKVSKYVRTIGVYDVWGYVGGEFGGGSWTIQRTNGTTDSVDLNDIRVLFGFEWGRSDQLRTGRRIGFLEAGFVLEREVKYRDSPADNFNADETFMLRVGIGY
jgi:hypothetical protein